MTFARSSIVLAAAALATSLLSAGCIADGSEEDVDMVVDPDGLDADDWMVSSSTAVAAWDSGETNNLSAWMSVRCDLDYGTGYMLTGLNAFQENTGNLDNFIGKMGANCKDYDLLNDSLPQTGAIATQNIFTSTHYRTGSLSTNVPTSDAYPIGLDIKVDSGNNYVKDVRIAYAHKTATGHSITSSSPWFTDWAIGYSGTTVTHRCADQRVMTGLQLKYDTDKGKIRKLQIFCADLDFAF